MRSRHALLRFLLDEALLALVLAWLLGCRVLAVCPSTCSCSRSHREVDCSWKGLRQLPDGLQHNLRSLNLSHNRFHGLDGELATYTHLRVLDLSHNQLSRLPEDLPRSLWQVHAAANRIRLLHKNDTVFQWNLRTLGLAHNKLEKAVFINNTLTNLRTLDLSHNHFWTLPTNLPSQLETVDLSHNLLVKVLPGSLDRLPRLTHFYLHANRLSSLPGGALDGLPSLRVVTLGNNPWACHLDAHIAYVLRWTQNTPARVLGCPCHTQPTCGGVRLSRTGGWHFASYNLPPLAASAPSLNAFPPEASVTEWWYFSSSDWLSTPHPPEEAAQGHTRGDTAISISSPFPVDHLPGTGSPADVHHLPGTEATSPSDSLKSKDSGLIIEPSMGNEMLLPTDRFFTTESNSIQTKKTSTLRTRSVRRQNPSSSGGVSISGPAPAVRSWLLFLLSFTASKVF
ncbi:oligodendrocyte-myelin glycoprotein-like [Cololabis saira]|uniref:oligodendrocyte-myelin glycoprotein-like n=1 Tax=Cololabis saira TaxID=129043 RepID=UPI002AD463AC|nr:oligodendrocyte-myelin glycoprotein-like [Cololabis saira]